jgi:hypothetical protein
MRRLAFFFVTLAPLALGLAAIVLPVWEHFDAQEAEIALQAERLARLKGIAAYAPASSSPPQGQDGSGEYVTGPNESVAGANLQTTLKGLALSSGAQLQSVQGLPAASDGALRLIGARLYFSGRLEAVHQAILMIENAKPYMFITDAAIKTPRRIQGLGGQQAPPVIEAQLDVFSAFKTSGAAK